MGAGRQNLFAGATSFQRPVLIIMDRWSEGVPPNHLALGLNHTWHYQATHPRAVVVMPLADLVVRELTQMSYSQR